MTAKRFAGALNRKVKAIYEAFLLEENIWIEAERLHAGLEGFGHWNGPVKVERIADKIIEVLVEEGIATNPAYNKKTQKALKAAVGLVRDGLNKRYLIPSLPGGICDDYRKTITSLRIHAIEARLRAELSNDKTLGEARDIVTGELDRVAAVIEKGVVEMLSIGKALCIHGELDREKAINIINRKLQAGDWPSLEYVQRVLRPIMQDILAREACWIQAERLHGIFFNDRRTVLRTKYGNLSSIGDISGIIRDDVEGGIDAIEQELFTRAVSAFQGELVEMYPMFDLNKEAVKVLLVRLIGQFPPEQRRGEVFIEFTSIVTGSLSGLEASVNKALQSILKIYPVLVKHGEIDRESLLKLIHKREFWQVINDTGEPSLTQTVKGVSDYSGNSTLARHLAEISTMFKAQEELWQAAEELYERFPGFHFHKFSSLGGVFELGNIVTAISDRLAAGAGSLGKALSGLKQAFIPDAIKATITNARNDAKRLKLSNKEVKRRIQARLSQEKDIDGKLAVFSDIEAEIAGFVQRIEDAARGIASRRPLLVAEKGEQAIKGEVIGIIEEALAEDSASEETIGQAIAKAGHDTLLEETVEKTLSKYFPRPLSRKTALDFINRLGNPADIFSSIKLLRGYLDRLEPAVRKNAENIIGSRPLLRDSGVIVVSHIIEELYAALSKWALEDQEAHIVEAAAEVALSLDSNHRLLLKAMKSLFMRGRRIEPADILELWQKITGRNHPLSKIVSDFLGFIIHICYHDKEYTKDKTIKNILEKLIEDPDMITAFGLALLGDRSTISSDRCVHLANIFAEIGESLVPLLVRLEERNIGGDNTVFKDLVELSLLLMGGDNAIAHKTKSSGRPISKETLKILRAISWPEETLRGFSLEGNRATGKRVDLSIAARSALMAVRIIGFFKGVDLSSPFELGRLSRLAKLFTFIKGYYDPRTDCNQGLETAESADNIGTKDRLAITNLLLKVPSKRGIRNTGINKSGYTSSKKSAEHRFSPGDRLAMRIYMEALEQLGVIHYPIQRPAVPFVPYFYILTQTGDFEIEALNIMLAHFFRGMKTWSFMAALPLTEKTSIHRYVLGNSNTGTGYSVDPEGSGGGAGQSQTSFFDGVMGHVPVLPELEGFHYVRVSTLRKNAQFLGLITIARDNFPDIFSRFQDRYFSYLQKTLGYSDAEIADLRVDFKFRNKGTGYQPESRRNKRMAQSLVELRERYMKSYIIETRGLLENLPLLARRMVSALLDLAEEHLTGSDDNSRIILCTALDRIRLILLLVHMGKIPQQIEESPSYLTLQTEINQQPKAATSEIVRSILEKFSEDEMKELMDLLDVGYLSFAFRDLETEVLEPTMQEIIEEFYRDNPAMRTVDEVICGLSGTEDLLGLPDMIEKALLDELQELASDEERVGEEFTKAWAGRVDMLRQIGGEVSTELINDLDAATRYAETFEAAIPAIRKVLASLSDSLRIAKALEDIRRRIDKEINRLKRDDSEKAVKSSRQALEEIDLELDDAEAVMDGVLATGGLFEWGQLKETFEAVRVVKRRLFEIWAERYSRLGKSIPEADIPVLTGEKEEDSKSPAEALYTEYEQEDLLSTLRSTSVKERSKLKKEIGRLNIIDGDVGMPEQPQLKELYERIDSALSLIQRDIDSLTVPPEDSDTWDFLGPIKAVHFLFHNINMLRDVLSTLRTVDRLLDDIEALVFNSELTINLEPSQLEKIASIISEQERLFALYKDKMDETDRIERVTLSAGQPGEEKTMPTTSVKDVQQLFKELIDLDVLFSIIQQTCGVTFREDPDLVYKKHELAEETGDAADGMPKLASATVSYDLEAREVVSAEVVLNPAHPELNSEADQKFGLIHELLEIFQVYILIRDCIHLSESDIGELRRLGYTDSLTLTQQLEYAERVGISEEYLAEWIKLAEFYAAQVEKNQEHIDAILGETPDQGIVAPSEAPAKLAEDTEQTEPEPEAAEAPAEGASLSEIKKADTPPEETSAYTDKSNEFWNVEKDEINLSLLESFVAETSRSLSKKLGRPIEAIIVGGTRYLKSGSRRDIDMVLLAPEAKDTKEQTALIDKFLHELSRLLEQVSGVSVTPSGPGVYDLILTRQTGPQKKRELQIGYVFRSIEELAENTLRIISRESDRWPSEKMLKAREYYLGKDWKEQNADELLRRICVRLRESLGRPVTAPVASMPAPVETDKAIPAEVAGYVEMIEAAAPVLREEALRAKEAQIDVRNASYVFDFTWTDRPLNNLICISPGESKIQQTTYRSRASLKSARPLRLTVNGKPLSEALESGEKVTLSDIRVAIEGDPDVIDFMLNVLDIEDLETRERLERNLRDELFFETGGIIGMTPTGRVVSVKRRNRVTVAFRNGFSDYMSVSGDTSGQGLLSPVRYHYHDETSLPLSAGDIEYALSNIKIPDLIIGGDNIARLHVPREDAVLQAALIEMRAHGTKIGSPELTFKEYIAEAEEILEKYFHVVDISLAEEETAEETLEAVSSEVAPEEVAPEEPPAPAAVEAEPVIAKPELTVEAKKKVAVISQIRELMEFLIAFVYGKKTELVEEFDRLAENMKAEDLTRMHENLSRIQAFYRDAEGLPDKLTTEVMLSMESGSQASFVLDRDELKRLEKLAGELEKRKRKIDQDFRAQIERAIRNAKGDKGSAAFYSDTAICYPFFLWQGAIKRSGADIGAIQGIIDEIKLMLVEEASSEDRQALEEARRAHREKVRVVSPEETELSRRIGINAILAWLRQQAIETKKKEIKEKAASRIRQQQQAEKAKRAALVSSLPFLGIGWAIKSLIERAAFGGRLYTKGSSSVQNADGSMMVVKDDARHAGVIDVRDALARRSRSGLLASALVIVAPSIAVGIAFALKGLAIGTGLAVGAGVGTLFETLRILRNISQAKLTRGVSRFIGRRVSRSIFRRQIKNMTKGQKAAYDEEFNLAVIDLQTEAWQDMLGLLASLREKQLKGSA